MTPESPALVHQGLGLSSVSGLAEVSRPALLQGPLLAEPVHATSVGLSDSQTLCISVQSGVSLQTSVTAAEIGGVRTSFAARMAHGYPGDKGL